MERPVDNRVDNPVKSALLRILDRIAEGRLSNRVRIDRRDEIGQVEAGLATMQVHVKVMIDDLTQAATLMHSHSQGLHQLMSQPGRVLTRDRLEEVLYGWSESAAESNALEVHIHHLRRKLYPELIRTVRGVGYRIDPA